MVRLFLIDVGHFSFSLFLFLFDFTSSVAVPSIRFELWNVFTEENISLPQIMMMPVTDSDDGTPSAPNASCFEDKRMIPVCKIVRAFQSQLRMWQANHSVLQAFCQSDPYIHSGVCVVELIIDFISRHEQWTVWSEPESCGMSFPIFRLWSVPCLSSLLVLIGGQSNHDRSAECTSKIDLHRYIPLALSL